METKITKEKLKLLLSKDFQLISTNNGKRFDWTCSTLSRTGNCVDVVRNMSDGEWLDTIFIDKITHIFIRKKDGTKAIYEVEK